MADGTIVRWLKHEGDPVTEGEPLVEVEAAKVTSEVEAEVSGVLARILVAEGETVPVRTPLCVIGSAGEVMIGGVQRLGDQPPHVPGPGPVQHPATVTPATDEPGQQQLCQVL